MPRRSSPRWCDGGARPPRRAPLLSQIKRAWRAVSGRARSDEVAPRRLRIESFGAIAQLVTPRALVFVDRTFARELGVPEHARWTREAEDGQVGAVPLSAPLEAHLQLTNRCDAGCKGCYTGATPTGAAGELGLDEWKRAVDALADAGVFHLALGGGESALLPWLGELAAYARDRGLVPNLTTSGLAGLDNVVAHAHLFGQINVSMDGLGADYAAVRGFDGFAQADAALVALRNVKREIGINTVVTRHNFERLDDIFAYARRRKLNEIELLRFKPAGRGAAAFRELTCTDAQHRRLLPTVLAAAKRNFVRVHLDSSYAPMIAHHQPDPALLAQLAVYGCTGGDFLIGARASGTLSACSFATPPADKPRVHDLARYWTAEGAFGTFRTWRDAAEPCASCAYHALCRGGCAVVSSHLTGDPSAPDPECPRVIDARAADAAAEPRRHLPVLM